MQKLFTDIDLEAFTGRSRSSWQKDRFNGNRDGIPFIRCGRLIRYRQEDVLAWLERHTTPTS